MSKKETVAEFLARGGQITKLPPSDAKTNVNGIKSNNNGGIAVIISMDDASLYGGEYKPKKTKKKAKQTIDVSALPEELRKQYIDGVLNGGEESNQED